MIEALFYFIFRLEPECLHSICLLFKVNVLSFMDSTEASYLQEFLDGVKTLRAPVLKFKKVHDLRIGPIQGDLLISQVIKRIEPAVVPEANHRKLGDQYIQLYDRGIATLEKYLALIQLNQIKDKLVAVLDTEDYNASLQRKQVMPEFQELFNQISVPVQEWEKLFGQHHWLAETSWIALTWAQRLSLKQGFLARELYKYVNEVSPL